MHTKLDVYGFILNKTKETDHILQMLLYWLWGY